MDIGHQKIRQTALNKYYKNPNICLHCSNIIYVKDNESPAQSRKKKFCSHSCSAKYHKLGGNKPLRNLAGRTFSVETRKKKSIAQKKVWASFSEEKRKKVLQPLIEATRYKSQHKNEILLAHDFNSLGHRGKRRFVILEQHHKCNLCELNTWRGVLLTLELEHKDGNNKNNERSNLEALCPNCHSLTITWRGRNQTGDKNSSRRRKLKRLGIIGPVAQLIRAVA